MDIKGKIHCFFEQSGTFKNEFKKLGFEAEDYDIQNEFGETNNVIDLFAEIEKCYNGEASIFDKQRRFDISVLSVYIFLLNKSNGFQFWLSQL